MRTPEEIARSVMYEHQDETGHHDTWPMNTIRGESPAALWQCQECGWVVSVDYTARKVAV